MANAEQIVLRAHGVLYSLQVEVEAGELDWLDRTILALTKTPRVLGELTDCFGLPRRMVEDAVGRLIERQLLLLDVGHATVWASGVAAEIPLRRVTDVLLVWQDHVTGMLFPWDVMKSFSRPPESDEQVGDQAIPMVLRGGPPTRTLFEMSDTEILAGLEGFVASATLPERTSGCELVRRQYLSIRALRNDSGAVVPIDIVPWLLWRNWLSLGAIDDAGVLDAPPIPLPLAWAHTVGRWAQTVAERIETLARGRVASDNNDAVGALAALHTDLGANVRQVWWAAPSKTNEEGQLLDLTGHPLVVASGRDGEVGTARAFLRRAHSTRGETDGFLVLCGATQRTLTAERHLLPEVKVVGHDRPDVEFAVVDERVLLVGALQTGQAFTLALLSERPMLSHMVWALQGAHPEPTDVRRSSGSANELRARVRSLEDSVRELEESIGSEGGERAEHMPDACDHLTRELNNIAAELNMLDVIPSRVLEADELLEVMRQNAQGRLLIREAASPLTESIGSGYDVVVWSRNRPDGPSRFRWMAVPGPCEIVILGDVVVLGWWSCAGGGDVPPFLAMHSPKLASELLGLSSRAAPLDSESA